MSWSCRVVPLVVCVWLGGGCSARCVVSCCVSMVNLRRANTYQQLDWYAHSHRQTDGERMAVLFCFVYGMVWYCIPFEEPQRLPPFLYFLVFLSSSSLASRNFFISFHGCVSAAILAFVLPFIYPIFLFACRMVGYCGFLAECRDDALLSFVLIAFYLLPMSGRCFLLLLCAWLWGGVGWLSVWLSLSCPRLSTCVCAAVLCSLTNRVTWCG